MDTVRKPISLLALLILFAMSQFGISEERPNILWLTSEDHGPAIGCYGDTLARTPNVDALASKGMIFRTAWSVAPVCAPARTAIITGLYPSSSGGLHMRSMVSLPNHIRAFPQILQDADYYCTNNSKTDYNVRFSGRVWNESSNKAHWRKRPKGQPFFSVFNSTKSHESQIRTRPHQQIADPAKVRIPSYHPDTPEVRRDWAQYYDKVSQADDELTGSDIGSIGVTVEPLDLLVYCPMVGVETGPASTRSSRICTLLRSNPCVDNLACPLKIFRSNRVKAT